MSQVLLQCNFAGEQFLAQFLADLRNRESLHICRETSAASIERSIECGIYHTSTGSKVIVRIVAQMVNSCKLKITSVPIKFCAAKQRIKVLKGGIQIDHRRFQKLGEKRHMADGHEAKPQNSEPTDDDRIVVSRTTVSNEEQPIKFLIILLKVDGYSTAVRVLCVAAREILGDIASPKGAIPILMIDAATFPSFEKGMFNVNCLLRNK